MWPKPVRLVLDKIAVHTNDHTFASGVVVSASKTLGCEVHSGAIATWLGRRGPEERVVPCWEGVGAETSSEKAE